VIGSTRQVSVWAFGEPVDMRKSFDTLHALVTQNMQRDLLSGDLFLFVGRDRKRAKVLLWDGTGMCIYAKRLSKGHFAAPWRNGGESVRMTMSELTLLLEGCALVGKIELSPAAFAFPSKSTSSQQLLNCRMR
jgi:transposase